MPMLWFGTLGRASRGVKRAPGHQCRLAQRWSNVGAVVPTLGQHWPNLYCCVGTMFRPVFCDGESMS